MYHVFADLGEFAGGKVLASQTSDNLRIEGIALRRSGRTRLLIANMTAETQQVQICNLDPQVVCHRLDENNVLEAMQTPESFRQRQGQKLVTQDGVLILEMPPYGLARLDS